MYFHSSTLRELDETISKEKILLLVPLRLWEIDYNKSDEEYYFYNLKNEKIIINKNNKYLWQKASGKNTIDDIINNSNSPFKYSDIYYIYSFYQKLQNNFAVIFREF